MKGSSYLKYFSLNEASSPLFFVLCSKSVPVLCSLLRFPICLCLWIRTNPSQFCVHSSDSFSPSPLDQMNPSQFCVHSSDSFSLSPLNQMNLSQFCVHSSDSLSISLWIRMNPSHFCVHSSDSLSVSPFGSEWIHPGSVFTQISSVRLLWIRTNPSQFCVHSDSFSPSPLDQMNPSRFCVHSSASLSVSPFGSEWIHPSSVFTHQIPCLPLSIKMNQSPLCVHSSDSISDSISLSPLVRANPTQLCIHLSDSFRLSPLDQNSELPFSMTISRLNGWERWPGYARFSVSVAFVLVINVNNCKVLWALERKGTL